MEEPNDVAPALAPAPGADADAVPDPALGLVGDPALAADAVAAAAAAANPDPSLASISKMVADKFEEFKHFLFDDFLSLRTLTTKDYEKEDVNKSEEEREKKLSDRFAGYQKLCLFGLGSMFWGSVAGVLADIENKDKPEWVNYCFLYADIALVMMLVGLAASTFPHSSWLAPAMSGAGSLQAFIFILGAFHIGSLKYHSYLKECLYSMTACTIVITIYWGLSVQDPLLLHIVTKFVLWVIGIIVYGVGFVLYQIYLFMKWIVCGFVRLSSSSWKYFWTDDYSIKNRLVSWYNKPREYEELRDHNV